MITNLGEKSKLLATLKEMLKKLFFYKTKCWDKKTKVPELKPHVLSKHYPVKNREPFTPRQEKRLEEYLEKKPRSFHQNVFESWKQNIMYGKESPRV